MKQTLWLAYDLGVKGDYEGLFAWLDSRSAVECAGNFAYLAFEYEADVLKELRASLEEAVEFDGRSRIYVIYKKPNGHRQGRFLKGTRKAPPWAGFAPPEEGEIADNDEA